MSEYLNKAKRELDQPDLTTENRLQSARLALRWLIAHLEAQEQSQSSRPVTEMLLQLTERVVALESEMEEMRHWQLGHTTRRPPLSNVLTSEITPESLERWMSFAASSPTTASPTTEGSSGAGTSEAHSIPRAPLEELATVSIGVQTPLSVRLLGVLTVAERTHVVQCSECWDPLVKLQSSWETHVRAARGTTSISAKPASKPSVDSEGPAASPSAESSEVPGDRGQAPADAEP